MSQKMMEATLALHCCDKMPEIVTFEEDRVAWAHVHRYQSVVGP